MLKKSNTFYFMYVRNGESALHWAVKKGHKDIAKLLIDKGAAFNAKNMQVVFLF